MSPIFVIVSFSTGVSPTTYVDLSVRALTLIEESWQSTGAPVGLASSVAKGDGDSGAGALEDGSAEGCAADWLMSGEGLACSCAARPVANHQMPKIRVPTARSKVIRLIQYTKPGSGPMGTNRPLTFQRYWAGSHKRETMLA